MLERVDRVQLAVRDRRAAARTFAEVLGAADVAERPSAHLGATRLVVGLGDTEIELCEPTGAGLAADHLAHWGEGLLTAGFATRDVDALARHLAGDGVRLHRDGDQVYVPATETAGLPVVLSPAHRRPSIGLTGGLYEVTNTLVSDWKTVAARYARMFGLDPQRFSPITSAHFGYTGTLTLFDPPARLDRIELSQVTDPASAMGRFVARRGDSLYMAYLETDDVGGLVARLAGRGARFTPRGRDAAGERDGLWIHPSVLHGMLLGVSRTTLAWEWSGRPSLVKPMPASI